MARKWLLLAPKDHMNHLAVNLIGFAVGFSIELLIETAFLTLALWIMIKLQKLDYNFFGLVGSAALSCAIDIFVSHFLGWGVAALASVPIQSF